MTTHRPNLTTIKRLNTVTLDMWQMMAIEVALDKMVDDVNIHQPSLESLRKLIYTARKINVCIPQ